MHLPRSTRVLALVIAALTVTGLAIARCELEPRTAAVHLAAVTGPAPAPPGDELGPWRKATTTTTTTATTTPPVPSTTPHRAPAPSTAHHAAKKATSGHWHPGGPCPSPSQCPQLRQCENGRFGYGHGDSPGFDGAYQFDKDSPWGMSPADQDARADAMYADRGADPWPTCGRYLR